MSSDYGHAERAAALALPEGDLRHRVDVLLEQCGREAAHTPIDGAWGNHRPSGPYLHVSEVLMLLGVGPSPRRGAYETLQKIIDGTVDGIRPHTGRPEDDAQRRAFADMFPGFCADGTCGTCGACELRRDEGE
jgi:hypothetical protein